MLPGVNLDHFIRTIGIIGVMAIVFAETGLLVGFFLPGDSLLFTAGFLASQGLMDIKFLAPGVFIAAVAGNCTGYGIGHRFGRTLFTRPESRFFKPKHAEQAQAFFEKHGGKAVTLAQFTPIIRTFVPVISGVGAMRFRKFLVYNVAGALIWAAGVTLAGYWLGNTIPNVDKYLLPIIVVIIGLSILPSALHIYKENGDQIKAGVRARMGKRAAAADTDVK
jgi:membrane-associated protein